jgi:hypothetical protein
MLALEAGAKITSAAKSSWPHLDEHTVMSRVTDLKTNPNLIKQGALPLCGEAAFFHHVLQRRPLVLGVMAKLLFMDGIGFLGDLVIRPDDDLLNANYGQIVADRGNESPPIPPQADWMMLSALCDTANYLIDFEGKPQEQVAGITGPSTLRSWYEDSRLYKKVELELTTPFSSLESDLANVVKTSSTHITLLIKTRLINSTANPLEAHYITLETALAFNSSAQTVTFDYWTWGNVIKTTTFTYSHFHDNYFGAVIATF